MKRTEPQIIELEAEKLEGMVRRAQAKQFEDEDYEVFQALSQSYAYLIELLKKKNVSVGRLRKLLFGASTEKTKTVLDSGTAAESPESSAKDDAAAPTQETEAGKKPTKRPKGHGRNGADAYRGAEKIPVSHESLEAADPCPECRQGTVYDVAHPGVMVRIVGQAPVHAKVYERQKLRCNLCGKVFTAQAPEGAGSEKYDATAASMIALLKYGSGLPFNRLQGLQGNLGIPLPASTQWDVVHALAKLIKPVYREFIRLAAQGDVLFNDDTTIKILELMGKRAKQKAFEENSAKGSTEANAPKRTGLFTSGIVSTCEGRKIALFFSGRKHAGENLKDVLVERAATLAPPIQMCDALSRNLPAELKTIVANCLSHGRRQFVDVAESFPEECRHVLESLAVIYRNDAIAREQNLSPLDRLHFHQAESGPTMGRLHAWLSRQLEERLVEPNSALGGAIAYMLRHWEKLTLFLRQPGAPLDNNICERALKKAILHRKNSLFYKTQNGAHVGDLFMSLIYTCEICGADPFDYLTELQRHVQEASSNPGGWMPWNYQERSMPPP